MIAALSEILDDTEEVTTVINKIESRNRRRRTGDKRYDGWNDALDRGVVPLEFWGDAGPPEDLRHLYPDLKVKGK